MPGFEPGQFVTMGRREPSTGQITSVTRDGVTYASADGVREHVHATAHLTLADQTRSWRPATAEEITAFNQRRRPAPENWH
ncbi:hypothetical protein RM572_00570 [Streptomyces sp. DSM 42041]|uniref:Uncharacterized protein n=1 Tax=Streptomyces hazeniae TaxID=3075538 RepID=A0ABU2NKK5_9ACTN|nr:hypothetical protein [Streptomyces sp. DSM 42041]MDT0377269.1 hypothetical protein [Streptomyces sp. DSM 42041]